MHPFYSFLITDKWADLFSAVGFFAQNLLASPATNSFNQAAWCFCASTQSSFKSKTAASRKCTCLYKYFLRDKHLINFFFHIHNHQVHSQVFYLVEEVRYTCFYATMENTSPELRFLSKEGGSGQLLLTEDWDTTNLKQFVFVTV